MSRRDLTAWDPVHDGSYIAALLDCAAEARDLRRQATQAAVASPKHAWQQRQRQFATGQPDPGLGARWSATPTLRTGLPAPQVARR
jgi:hypothetical protein